MDAEGARGVEDTMGAGSFQGAWLSDTFVIKFERALLFDTFGTPGHQDTKTPWRLGAFRGRGSLTPS